MLMKARPAVTVALEVYIRAGQEHRGALFEEWLRELDEKITALTNPKP